MLKRIAAFIIIAFIGGSALSKGTAESGEEKPVTRYINCDFGYVVQVPHKLIGRVPAYSSHGFRIDLPDGKSIIEIYNAFNMSESTSFSDIVRYELELRAEGKANWRIINRRVGQTKGLESTEITATYASKTEAWKAEALIVYRPTRTDDLGNIVYVLELSSPAALYDNALEKFNETVGGFQLTDLPRGPCSNH